MTKFPSKKEIEEIRTRMDSAPAARPLPRDADSVDRAKYEICEKFVIYKNSNDVSQRELANKIGIDEAIMSKILHYKIDEFTTDRLIKFLSELFEKVNIKIDVA